MMTNGLNDLQVKIVTYLVYVLLAILTLVMTFNSLTVASHERTINEMPDKFVRLERYQSDQQNIKENQRAIMDKLDRLIERQSKIYDSQY